jgi:hypothetical protein
MGNILRNVKPRFVVAFLNLAEEKFYTSNLRGAFGDSALLVDALKEAYGTEHQSEVARVNSTGAS